MKGKWSKHFPTKGGRSHWLIAKKFMLRTEKFQRPGSGEVKCKKNVLNLGRMSGQREREQTKAVFLISSAEEDV